MIGTGSSRCCRARRSASSDDIVYDRRPELASRRSLDRMPSVQTCSAVRARESNTREVWVMLGFGSFVVLLDGTHRAPAGVGSLYMLMSARLPLGVILMAGRLAI
jgi:hypothetical protein